MGMLAKIRRMHFREHLPLREIARQTGLARNTIRQWLMKDVVEPQDKKREAKSVVDSWTDQLAQWLKSDSHRPKRDRRTAVAMFKAIRAQGYSGSYNRAAPTSSAGGQQNRRSRGRPTWRCPSYWAKPSSSTGAPSMPSSGGLRRKLEVAHTKLCARRAFWLTAYYAQSHEMLFDAHARAFATFGGVPQRGIYDNMKTAVDKVGRGKERDINPRFYAMCGHYLFDSEFCNRAAD